MITSKKQAGRRESVKTPANRSLKARKRSTPTAQLAAAATITECVRSAIAKAREEIPAAERPSEPPQTARRVVYSEIVFADRYLQIAFDDSVHTTAELRQNATELSRAAMGTARALKQLWHAADEAFQHGRIFEQDQRDVGVANEFILAVVTAMLEHADELDREEEAKALESAQ